MKAGLLVILLAVPAFLFLFLFFFGENRFDLPYLLNLGIVKNGDIELNENCRSFSKPDFLIDNSGKTEIQSDSIYLIFDGLTKDDSKSIRIIYDCINEKGPSENHIAELKRLKDKIQNKRNIELLILYGADKNEKYFNNLFEFLKSVYTAYYFPDGMLLLIDENNYFRGIYNPTVKAEVDRLVTEYQILLDR
ncbi:MAG: hypothetical protein RH860_04180 [Cytophagales bacterium]